MEEGEEGEEVARGEKERAVRASSTPKVSERQAAVMGRGKGATGPGHVAESAMQGQEDSGGGVWGGDVVVTIQ